MMLPVVDDLETEFSKKWRVRRIDIEKETDLASAYEVEMVPTFIMQRDGKEIGRMAGMIGEETLKRRLAELEEQRKIE